MCVCVCVLFVLLLHFSFICRMQNFDSNGFFLQSVVSIILFLNVATIIYILFCCIVCSCVCHQWQVDVKADLCLNFILVWYRITIIKSPFFHRQERHCWKLSCYNYYSCSLIWLISDIKLKKNTWLKSGMHSRGRKVLPADEAPKPRTCELPQSHYCPLKHTHNKLCAEYYHLDNHLFI